MIKTSLLNLGIVVLFLGLTAGCSSSSETGGSSNAQNESVNKSGAEYPKRPITVVVPWGPGGGSDQMVRTIVKAAEDEGDAEFVVQNMPGAAGLTGLNNVMNKPADGYVVYEMLSSQIVQMVRNQTEYTLEDIIPIASTQKAISFLFIKSDEERFSNFDELVEYAKANDGEVKIAVLSDNGFDAALLRPIEEKYGFKFKMVPFNKPAQRYAALDGGHVDVLFEQIGDVRNFVESEKYKPILTYNKERIEAFSDVPTTVEKGMDATTGFIRGFWVKAGTPQYVVDYLTNIIEKATQTESWKEFEKQQFTHLRPGYSGSEEFKELLDSTFKQFQDALGE
jgi:putative tricarboxylic transport membrane protein